MRYKICICQCAHTHSATAARLDLCDMLQIYMFELPHNIQTNMRKQGSKACGAEQAECVDAKVKGVDAEVKGVDGGVWCRASRRRGRRRVVQGK